MTSKAWTSWKQYKVKQQAQLLLADRATRKHAKDCWNGRGNDSLGWNGLQMYFKVIRSGNNRKLVYDFLLVVYSNFCRITHRFWEFWCETVQWPWNMLKVIDTHITWKLSETMFPGLHFCRWQYMGSSANFLTVLSESRRCQPISCRVRNRF